MAFLVIRQQFRGKRKPRFIIPHKVLINGQLVGIMQQPEVTIQMPPQSVEVTIQSLFPFISSSVSINVDEGVPNLVQFHDKEFFWNLLFGIDLLFSIVKLFLSLSPSANLIYHICSDGFFALWCIRVWCIRKRYFAIMASHS